MTDRQHKLLSTIIVTVGAFLGFEAISLTLSLYQLNTAFKLSLLVYAFHIFWLTFVFDLHLKKRVDWTKSFKDGIKDRFQHIKNLNYWRHYQNYLVLPGLIYWGTVTLMLLNPFNNTLKLILVLVSTVALNIAYWFMKEHVSRNLEHKNEWIRVLALVKIYCAYLIFSATFGATLYNGFGTGFLFAAITTLTFLLLYQVLFQHDFINFRVTLWLIAISLLIGLVSFWIYSVWSAQYFSAGLVMLAIYNALWGILHHYLENNLTKKIAFEYLAMMIFIVTFVLASHNFSQRIV